MGMAALPPPPTRGMWTMFFFQRKGCSFPAIFGRKPEHLLSDGIVFIVRALCMSLISSWRTAPTGGFSHGFLFFCRLQAGNWKMDHRKPGLPHLPHFVTAALVSFRLCVSSILTLHTAVQLFSKGAPTSLRLRMLP